MKKAFIAIALLVLASASAFALLVGPLTAEQANDPVFYNELGYRLAQAGDMAGAQAAFAKAVRLDASYENARRNLYVAAFQNGGYAAAAEHLRILIAQHDTAQYRFDLAQALVAHARTHETDADAAIAQLQEALTHLDAAGDYPHARENAQIVRAVLAEHG